MESNAETQEGANVNTAQNRDSAIPTRDTLPLPEGRVSCKTLRKIVQNHTTGVQSHQLGEVLAIADSVIVDRALPAADRVQAHLLHREVMGFIGEEEAYDLRVRRKAEQEVRELRAVTVAKELLGQGGARPDEQRDAHLLVCTYGEDLEVAPHLEALLQSGDTDVLLRALTSVSPAFHVKAGMSYLGRALGLMRKAEDQMKIRALMMCALIEQLNDPDHDEAHCEEIQKFLVEQRAAILRSPEAGPARAWAEYYMGVYALHVYELLMAKMHCESALALADEKEMHPCELYRLHARVNEVRTEILHSLTEEEGALEEEEEDIAGEEWRHGQRGGLIVDGPGEGEWDDHSAQDNPPKKKDDDLLDGVETE